MRSCKRKCPPFKTSGIVLVQLSLDLYGQGSETTEFNASSRETLKGRKFPSTIVDQHKTD